MALPSIQVLLKENESELLRERRAADRKPFARPVQIAFGREGESIQGFSRDISTVGIGLLAEIDFDAGTPAILTIHSVTHSRVIRVMAEARWCQPYGDGWFLSGWAFIRETI